MTRRSRPGCLAAAAFMAVALLCAACDRKRTDSRDAGGGQERGQAPAISIAGSGSNIPLTQKLLDAYNEKKGLSFHIPPSIGTSGAIKALQAGKLDIGLISRPLKAAELDSGIEQRGYARIGVVLAVHPSVPESDLASSELVEIYKGSKSRWKNGKTIIVLAREAGDSSNAVLAKAIPGFNEALAEALEKKRWEIYYTDAEEIEAIRTIPNSIGLADLGASIKALRLDGAEPRLENVSKGSYPLFKDLSFAFKEPLSGEARAFMDFVASAEGGRIVSGNGGIPLEGD